MPIRWAYLKRILAGAIFGLYMANLLFFLNPQVDITPGRLVLVTVVYGLICGMLFGSALWGLRALRVRIFGRPQTARMHGFGFVPFAAFASAVIYWIHLTYVRDYLPVGAVRILSKATNAITVTAFILLMVWVLERNADRRLSRALFACGVVLIVVSAFFLYQRRESYRTERRNVVVANIGAVARHRPVMVVAIRNLPYDWIITMRGEGLLPFFDHTADRAFFTRVEPFPTTSPKSLWASLATGKLPYRHGVTGRFSYRTPLNRDDPFLLLPSGVGFRAWGLIPPVERISAPLPAGNALPLWTIFERLQLHASVVNWPSSHRGGAFALTTDEDIRRATPLAIPNDLAQRFNGTGAVRPRLLEALSRDVAAAARASQGSSLPLSVLALEGFADAQRALHIFANEIPPRDSVKGAAVRAYVQQLDRMLAELARANPEHVIVIVSPSAVTPPELSADAYALAMHAISRDDPGADDGFVLIAGPGAAHRENPQAARVVDVVPTVLFAARLPVGRDMDGRVLTDAFDEEFLRVHPLSAIQTYEAERVLVQRGG
ncbi:MAG TPA: alkaline phosphatase family protein [Thermoanaerobaculia bacterium]|nr:alkaline phosphatase family protein [Thermoanaerobaculia bacterium]